MATREKTRKSRGATAKSGPSRSAAGKAKGKDSRKTAPAAEARGITAKNLTSEDKRFLNRHRDQLSRTTLRAKWLHSSEEHEDRPGQSLATRSHEVIRHWAEERGAVPATVSSTRQEGRPGVLRFDFPGFGGKRLKEISWDEWLETFDERKLIFLFQEHQKAGNQSNFFRFDSPHRERA